MVYFLCMDDVACLFGVGGGSFFETRLLVHCSLVKFADYAALFLKRLFRGELRVAMSRERDGDFVKIVDRRKVDDDD